MFQASMYFIFLHFSALKNPHDLISKKAITFDKEMLYFGFLSTTIFIWRNGLKGIGVWMNHGIFSLIWDLFSISRSLWIFQKLMKYIRWNVIFLFKKSFSLKIWVTLTYLIVLLGTQNKSTSNLVTKLHTF